MSYIVIICNLESLFGCFDDMGICCCGFWCLPCLFGDNAEKIDGSSCVGMSLLYWLLGSCYVCWVPHMMKRKALRQKYRLRPEPCNDCLATLCCSGCAVCQEARELKARGLHFTKFTSYMTSHSIKNCRRTPTWNRANSSTTGGGLSKMNKMKPS